MNKKIDGQQSEKQHFSRHFLNTRVKALKGDAIAQTCIALWYGEGMEGAQQDFHEAMIWYKMAAEQDYPFAQFMLGQYYKNLEDVRNLEEAAKWFMRAASQGEAESQFCLCCMYDKGEGVPIDKEKKMKWLIAAAENDHPAAQYCLARAYWFGMDLPQDKEKGAFYLRKAAKHGMSDARKTLASLESNGEIRPEV